MCPTCSTDRRRRGGFSIAEAMTASVVLAIAMVGIAGPLGAASDQAILSRENGSAVVLARQLLEEISAKPMADGVATCHLGPEATSGETARSSYDSGDDYWKYSDRTNALGTLMGNSAGMLQGQVYTREVTFDYRSSASAGGGQTSGNFALLTVKVTSPHGQVVTVSKLLTRNWLTF